MKFKLLKNISDKNITDYPIAEAKTDSQGEVMYSDDGKMLVTERTLKWTIESGETIKLPEYVADILLERYGVEDPDAGRCLLTEVDSEVKEKEKPVATGVKKDYTCKKCGKSFVSAKGIALHMAALHEETLK